MRQTEHIRARLDVPSYNGNSVKQKLVKQLEVVKLLMSISGMARERGVSGIQQIYQSPKGKLDNSLRLQSAV